MIRVTTNNSVYDIRIKEENFEVRKVHELNVNSKYYAVGESFTCHRLGLTFGDSGVWFDNVQTSQVVSIEEVAE